MLTFYYQKSKHPKKTDYYIFNFRRQFNVVFSLWRTDDEKKPRIKKNKKYDKLTEQNKWN